jgi:O-antigen ligase
VGASDTIVAVQRGASAAGRSQAPSSVVAIPRALLAVLVLVGVSVGFLVASGPELSLEQLLVVLAFGGGVGLAVLVAQRFWWFILVVFAIRSSLDALKPSSGGAGIEAGTVVGVAFLAGAAAWLFVQWRTGELAPVSGSSKALLALATAFVVAAFGAEKPFQSMQQASKYVAIAIMFVVLEQIFRRDPQRVRPALVAVFVSLGIPAVVALSQVPGAHPTTGPGGVDVGRIQGTFVHPNVLAAYLVVVMLCAVALVPYLPRWRLGLVAVLVVASPLLLLTYARGAWIGLYLGVMFIGFAHSRALLVGLFVATALVVLLVPSVTARLSDLTFATPKAKGQVDANSAEWRVNYWIEVLPFFKESPLTGIGPDMIKVESGTGAPAHNAYIDVIVETGLFGTITLALALVTIGRAVLRAGRLFGSGLPRGLAVAAAAIGLALVFQFSSESLITQPAVLWYAVLPFAWVVAAPDARVETDPAKARSPVRLAS